ncbi:YtxH domain-containing protein [Mucilaginibacter terrenus]|uniref:YtxH domain-containing protein n=1 Tax=Mucilaginibacter terrenus TaxID=2482727 RepID=UPI00197B4AEA|nr:YtxH domain-containing protein [Mucilaginibacter terrenus]
MGLLRFIAVGAAIGYGINYITKKGPNGRSILDDITEDAPEWFDKAKKYAENAVDQASQTVKEKANYSEGV